MNTAAHTTAMVDNDPRSRSSIVTLKSHVFDIMNPSTWVFDIEDIATALSNISRFGGHLETHYSVAEHSLRVSLNLESLGFSPHVQLLGLLHDATEAYVGDIPSPIKKVMQIDGEPFADFEHGMFYALLTAYGLNTPDVDYLYRFVKDADYVVYLEERDSRPHPGAMYIHQARWAFLERFNQLWEQVQS